MPKERKGWCGVIPRLDGHDRQVKGPPVDPGRRAGLEPPDPKLKLAKARGEGLRGRVPGAAARVLGETDVNASGEERTHREYHGARAEGDPGDRDYPEHPAALDDQVPGLLLED